MRWIRPFGVLATACVLAVCGFSSDTASAQKEQAIGDLDNQSGIDYTMFDTSRRVQDDLFEFVNGSWLKNTDIPSDKSNYGSFIALADTSQKRIKKLIESAAAMENAPGSDAAKVGDFYSSYMNEKLCDRLGINPLKAELARIQKISSKTEMLAYIGSIRKIGVGTPIGFGVSVDSKDSTRYMAMAGQSGITLPDRDYYLKDDDKYVDARDALAQYVDTLFKLASIQSDGAGKRLVELEGKLAKAHWPKTKLRDANARYNKYRVSDLKKLTGSFDWKTVFEAIGVGEIQEVNIVTPSYFKEFAQIFDSTSLNQWKEYQTFQLLDGYATSLSSDFVDASFNLHQKHLAGIPENRPRWKRAVNTTSGVLGEVVGKLYVEKYFKPQAKARMKELVQNLLKAYKSSINDLSWMTDVTKKRAQEKLSKITTKIGYPDVWKDYSMLEVKADDLVGNLMNSARVEQKRNIDKLGKPVDHNEWGMTPQTVNAYYNPTKNEIVFPAAILQPPFFNQRADDGVNYGGIGAVIGHEISHAFDDQGSKYDGDGNLNNWWTDKDRSAFKSLTDQLIAQYQVFSPLKDKQVNGQLTLGENIADLSGLTISYKAYKLSLGGDKSVEIAGWSGEQRFFLGWSQVWRRKYREAEMVKRLLTDPHSPSRYRANGPVTNIDAFQEAFNLKPGDKLYKAPKDRIQIW